MRETTIFLSKRNTDCLKGIFAILVLIHHTRAQMSCLNNTIVGMILTALGYLSVGAFLFFSGYGLELQFQKRGKKYIDELPKARIIPFYCICVFSVILYTVVKLILGVDFSIQEFIQSFLFGKTIVQNGWYLQAIIIIYLMFYLANKIFNDKKWLALCFFLLFYFVLCICVHTSETYYESILAFPFGVFAAQKKKALEKQILGKGSIIKGISCFGAFAITLVIGNINIMSHTITIVVKMVSVLFFIAVVLFVSQRIELSSRITEILGTIFCEIYIVQGVWISFLHSKYIYLSNDWIYLCVVSLLTIGSAYLLHPLFNLIMGSCRKKLLKD